MIIAHCDGLSELEFFNTASDDVWQPLTSLPPECGVDGVGIVGCRSKVSLLANPTRVKWCTAINIIRGIK